MSLGSRRRCTRSLRCLRGSGRSGESPDPWRCGLELSLSCRDSKHRGPRSALAASLCTPIPSREGQFGAEIREVPDSQSTPGEPWPVEEVPSRGEFSRVGPGGARRAERAAPPPGSRRGGPRRLRRQLPLPYKAGAGPRRGRGCGRPASSSGVQLRGAGKRAQRGGGGNRGARRAGHGQVR